MRHSNYDIDIENPMIAFYDSLSEKDRRRYAGVEAKKLGHGGIVYIPTLFSCDEKTIQRGLGELDDENKMKQASIRQPGGGAKSKIDEIDNIDDSFLSILVTVHGILEMAISSKPFNSTSTLK